jgi:hexosaminidase
MADRLSTLVPYPAKVRPGTGGFALHRTVKITAGPHASRAAEAVRQVLNTLPWPPDDTPQPGEILVATEETLTAEGYRLTITPDRVTITAKDPAGAFYAAQTIRQLLPDDAFRQAPAPTEPWVLPAAEIEDAPSLPWRGGHLDVSRHFFTKRTIFSFIDMLAAHKLNRLHLHLTDDQGWRIESERYPSLQNTASHRAQTQVGPAHEQPKVFDGTPHGGYYTLKDLAEITAYAGQRMIKVVPEIDIPGHAAALLAALPELSPQPGRTYEVGQGWGINTEIISPRPAAVNVLGEILGELLAAVPTDWVHIGGDECVLDDWRASPDVEAYRRELGLPSHEALHAYFLRQVADVLGESFGARAVVWDEGFASTTSGTGLRDDTLVMAWRGGDIGRRAALAGHDVITTPVIPTYFDYFQAADEREPLSIGGPVTIEDVAALEPVPADWPDSAKSHLIGTQFQVWSEYIPDPRALEYMAFPRACALAEVAWHGRPAPWAEQAGQEDGRPPLRERIAAHLGRLDAAGIEYRPLAGPHPWQQGGTGARRHYTGYVVTDVARSLAEQAET